MRHSCPSLRAALLGCALLAGSACAVPASAQATSDRDVPTAAAQKQAAEIARGDPSRWYRDDPTKAARMRTLQKEIGAALAEAKSACRKAPTSGRAGCLKEAQATWEQDMANARAQLDAAPSGSVETHTVPDTR